MQPARKMLLVFQGFVRDLTLVNTHATQLNLVFFYFIVLWFNGDFLQGTEHRHLQLNLM